MPVVRRYGGPSSLLILWCSTSGDTRRRWEERTKPGEPLPATKVERRLIVGGYSLSIVSVVVAMGSLTTAVASSWLAYCALQSSIQPVLVFTRRGSPGWWLENVGNGPALNLVIGCGDKAATWSRIMRAYPMAAGAKVAVEWAHPGEHLAATYEDARGKAYTSYCYCGKWSTQILRRNRFPHWRDIAEEWHSPRQVGSVPAE